jgi:hypothetical protein
MPNREKKILSKKTREISVKSMNQATANAQQRLLSVCTLKVLRPRHLHDAADTPRIHFEAVAFFEQNFRCEVIRCSTQGPEN